MNPIHRRGYEYQVGGSLPINAPTYVRRQADEDFYSYLKKGEFCYVLNSRQMGKSSLRVQTMQRLEDEGFACAAVDITAIGTADITPVEWYAGIIDYLVDSFNLYTDFELKSWWNENGLLSPVQHFSKFIETVLLEQVKQDIIIFIDEIDSILSLEFNLDDFFAVIRDCYNSRASQPTYNRLTFALLGVSTPSDLIQDRRRTPFNIGRAIDLTGFKLSEAEPLAQGLATLGNPQELMQAVLDWTGGQPFLTQRVCRLLLSEAGEERENLSTLVERLVRKQIINNWEPQDEPEHLKTIRDRILRGFEKGKGRLLGLCQQILASNQQGIVASDSLEQTQLRLTGLVVRRDGRLKIYNRIYESVFNLAWAEQELAKLRPYTDAFDAWIASNCKDESRLLRGQALQDTLVWSAGKSLDDQDYVFLAASQEIDKKDIQEKLKVEEKAKQVLTKANQQAKKQIHLGYGVLSFTLTIALGIGLWAGRRFNEVQQGTGLERSGFAIKQEFRQREIETLLSAMKAGQQLRELVNDGRSLVEYPTVAPMLALQTVLDNIREKTQFQVISSSKFDYLSKYTGYTDTDTSGTLFSPNGKYVVTSTRDGVVRVWNLLGQQVAALNIFENNSEMAAYFSTIHIEFSPDGKHILTSPSIPDSAPERATSVKIIQPSIWDISGKKLAVLKGHLSPAISSFSPDGKHIFTRSGNGGEIVKIWDMSGKQLTEFRATGIAVSNKDKPIQCCLKTIVGTEFPSINLSPDSKYILTLLGDNTAQLRDASGKQLALLQGHESQVTAAHFIPDGKSILTASKDGTLRFWSLSGKLQGVVKGHQGKITSISFSGTEVITTSANKIILVSYKNPGYPALKTIPVPQGNQGEIRSVSIHPNDYTEILTMAVDGTVILWDIEHGINFQKILSKNQKNIYAANFSPDGHHLITVSDDLVEIWDPYSGYSEPNEPKQPIVALPRINYRGLSNNYSPQGYGWSANFSVNGRYLAIISGNGSESAIGNFINIVQSKKVAYSLSLNSFKLQDSRRDIAVASLSSKEQKLFTLSTDEKIGRVWNLSREQFISINGTDASFSPDSQKVLTFNSGKLSLSDLAGRHLGNLPVLRGKIVGAEFSSDGQRIIAVSDDLNQTMYVWDVKSGSTLQKIQGMHDDQNNLETTTSKLNSNRIYNVKFSPDRNYFLTISHKDIVYLRNSLGKLIKVLQGDIKDASFSPNGQYIITTGYDKTARLWDLSGNSLAVLKGHQDIVSANFSADSQRIVTASTDKTVQLWNLSGKLLTVFRGHQGGINDVQFSPDGQRIITASQDNTVRIWNLSGTELTVLKEHQDGVMSARFSLDGQRIITISEQQVVMWDSLGRQLAIFQNPNGATAEPRFSADGQYIALGSAIKRIATLDELLGRGCAWLQDYFVTHPEALKNLKVCHDPSILKAAVPALVHEGRGLAIQGDIESAIAFFEQAVNLNPNLKLNPKAEAVQLADLLE